MYTYNWLFCSVLWCCELPFCFGSRSLLQVEESETELPWCRSNLMISQNDYHQIIWPDVRQHSTSVMFRYKFVWRLWRNSKPFDCPETTHRCPLLRRCTCAQAGPERLHFLQDCWNRAAAEPRTSAVFWGGSVCGLWMKAGMRAWHLSEAGYWGAEFGQRTRETRPRRNAHASFWTRMRPRRHLSEEKHRYRTVLGG